MVDAKIKRADAVRKRGPTIIGKTAELGALADIFTFAVYRDLNGNLKSECFVPDGEQPPTDIEILQALRGARSGGSRPPRRRLAKPDMKAHSGFERPSTGHYSQGLSNVATENLISTSVTNSEDFGSYCKEDDESLGTWWASEDNFAFTDVFNAKASGSTTRITSSREDSVKDEGSYTINEWLPAQGACLGFNCLNNSYLE